MTRKILVSPWPSLVWAILIFVLLSVNTGSMESVPLFGLKNLDKLVHAFLFGTMAFLLVYWLDGKGRNAWTLALAIASIYGIGMEFFQENFTSREFEWNDIYADVTGAILGSWAGKKIGPYGNRGRNQN